MPPIPLRRSQARAVALAPIRNQLISAVGDSLTDGMGPWPVQGVKSWLAWATLDSRIGGRFVPYHPYGVAGATTATVLSTAVPEILVLSPRPGYCCVMGGTNDAGQAVPLATTASNLTAIARTLLGAGIVPIMCTIPPRNAVGANTPTIRSATKLINAWVAAFAAREGIPLADIHGAVVDPASSTGSPLSGYVESDGVHQTAAGARAMGTALADTLALLPVRWLPRLARENNDTSLSLDNPLMLTGTGIATGWTLTQGTADTSLESAPDDVVGNWLKLDKTSGTDFTTLRCTAITGTPGDYFAFGGRFSFTAGTDGVLLLALGDYTSTAKTFCQVRFASPYTIAPTTFWVEDRVPDTITSGQITVWMGIGDGTGTARLGQATVRNLTALGLA